jgi:hypothetical protein
MVVNIARLFQVQLDRIHIPDDGTLSPNYDDNVFSISYKMLPPYGCTQGIDFCPVIARWGSSAPRVITDIGSPRDVPPPGPSPIISTGPIALVPGAPNNDLSFVILIINAGENQDVVSRNIAAAGKWVLDNCRDPCIGGYTNDIKGNVDSIAFAGGDQGGCDGTVVIGSNRITSSMLEQLMSSGEITVTDIGGLGSHGDCAGTLDPPFILHYSHYDYTWTLKWLPS